MFPAVTITSLKVFVWPFGLWSFYTVFSSMTCIQLANIYYMSGLNKHLIFVLCLISLIENLYLLQSE